MKDNRAIANNLKIRFEFRTPAIAKNALEAAFAIVTPFHIKVGNRIYKIRVIDIKVAIVYSDSSDCSGGQDRNDGQRTQDFLPLNSHSSFIISISASPVALSRS